MHLTDSSRGGAPRFAQWCLSILTNGFRGAYSSVRQTCGRRRRGALFSGGGCTMHGPPLCTETRQPSHRRRQHAPFSWFFIFSGHQHRLGDFRSSDDVVCPLLLPRRGCSGREVQRTFRFHGGAFRLCEFSRAVLFIKAGGLLFLFLFGSATRELQRSECIIAW
ncbi:hypothetical protein ABB37_01857 [Leptomonas pyrrhocoris]|uniref:Uncharacterized protein n=1 Tax=Leptomonas pyrrhocoris TaxID=157538 RepID=A0A0N0VGH0_LEPPY|nr:hypothetical protein ABB37_09970 [Leptomonas pyrrhocoris]XP_015661993.1 hypothetical protein ABB37_01857 [Leptomonas pyrrhocoris]XP_015661994.1 hypothetical protein ABB37_01857 [Leptomonas pyrrhocoris]KPA73253.1 hypothetical protein ABB37_09970 [Leptomonas pyrrhocoris]KPA83554.1 hypothetical protein ABB37_01857 [Leptomonas pyrrhocoris]KPA83555.1 hypothetical protein ABB37_01857 [Leptomonas pyrrhocoris]|eukprot:XP_015651692.1 hypothetical protein ABB37_09970 [Leptomonas pyrrhocoris]